MSDIERIELAIRRVLATYNEVWNAKTALTLLADELAKMKPQQQSSGVPEPGYKLKWVPGGPGGMVGHE